VPFQRLGGERLDRSLGIVLVGLGIAEVDQYAVTHEFATNPPKRCTASATHF
jgi:hypothetical protein